MENHYRRWSGVSGELRRITRQHRTRLTPSEAALWEALRAKRLHGLQFRSQYACEAFIFDFFCPKHRLIVEVDGGEGERREKDALRDAYLDLQGFTIVRVTSDEILNDLASVLDRIAAAQPQCQARAIRESTVATFSWRP